MMIRFLERFLERSKVASVDRKLFDFVVYCLQQSCSTTKCSFDVDCFLVYNQMLILMVTAYNKHVLQPKVDSIICYISFGIIVHQFMIVDSLFPVICLMISFGVIVVHPFMIVDLLFPIISLFSFGSTAVYHLLDQCWYRFSPIYVCGFIGLLSFVWSVRRHFYNRCLLSTLMVDTKSVFVSWLLFFAWLIQKPRLSWVCGGRWVVWVDWRLTTVPAQRYSSELILT